MNKVKKPVFLFVSDKGEVSISIVNQRKAFSQRSFAGDLLGCRLLFQGQNVGDCDFRTRLLCIRKELIGPRIEAIKSGRIRRENEPISIRMKVLTLVFLKLLNVFACE